MKLHAENMPLRRSLGFLWAGFYKYVAPLALGKAAVNAPQSRRSARFADARHARSVWSAGGFSTALGWHAFVSGMRVRGMTLFRTACVWIRRQGQNDGIRIMPSSFYPPLF